MQRLLENVINKAKNKSQATQSIAPGHKEDGDLGLHLVYEGAVSAVDIVAIHGQGGHWNQSWTDCDTGFFWLADILPSTLPNSRILSYGYQSTDAVPTGSIAAALMYELASMRNGNEGHPIIFLVHSFGGLMIKDVHAQFLVHHCIQM
jgi:hypothetical protein